jgi:hypothetical protein
MEIDIEYQSFIIELKLLSISKYNVLHCFLNNSRTERDIQLRFSPVERGGTAMYFSEYCIRRNHFKTDYFCKTGKMYNKCGNLGFKSECYVYFKK